MADPDDFSSSAVSASLSQPEWLAALREAGVVPLGVDAATRAKSASLVEWLVALWTAKALVSSVAQQRGIRRLIAQLKVLDAGVAELTVIDATSPPFRRRVMFAPKGQPKLPRVGIVSSRIKRQTALEQVWLATLRAACLQTKSLGQALLAVEGTSADRCVRRCGELFEIPTLALRVGEASDVLDDWFKQSLRDFAEVARLSQEFPVYVSPPLGAALPRSQISDFRSQISDLGSEISDLRSEIAATDVPERDRVLVEWGDRVVALALRAGGNCERLLRQRLAATTTASVQLCGDQRLISPRLSNELRTLGATTLGGCEDLVAELVRVPFFAGAGKSDDFRYDKSSPPLNVADAANSGLFLTHWTRGLEAVALKDLGDEQLDQWLLQPDSFDRSALGSLRRLVQERRLRGSREGLRGVVRVVCFSAVPLIELMQQRTYRVHRTRWDCEPYGLCVRRDVLQKLGARPVVYGDESDFAALPVEDRVWFQTRYSTLKSETIDWSHEQEWRLPGDVDLSLLSPSGAFVFVRTIAEVAQIKPLCDWPVIAMFPEDSGKPVG